MLNGAKIRELREKKGDTTAKLGIAVGLSDAMVSYIERNMKQPSVDALKRIADYLDVSIDDLLVKEPS